MPKQTERKKIEELLRAKRSRPKASIAKPNVTEIRSCGHMHHPPGGGGPGPQPGPGKGKASPERAAMIGEMIIIWEYSVDFYQVDEFHQFLATSEAKLARELNEVDPNAKYLGTYMRHAGGTPQYRTLWSYPSLDAMVMVWAKVASGSGEELKRLAMSLREYWLRDPDRYEDRYIVAANTAIDARDAPFARMTLDTHKRMMKS